MCDKKQGHYPSILEVAGIAKEYENAGIVTLKDGHKCEDSTEIKEEKEENSYDDDIAEKQEKLIDERYLEQIYQKLEEKISERFFEKSKNKLQEFTDIEINENDPTKPSEQVDMKVNEEESDKKDGNSDGINDEVKAKGDGGVVKETWARSSDFLFVVLAMMLEFWNFPYLIFREAGIAYLIPYTISLVVSWMPLFLLETTMAQYSGLGVLAVWKICPLLKGLGYVLVLKCLREGVVLNVLLAYFSLYIYNTSKTPAPWRTCENSWNSPKCAEMSRPETTSDLYYDDWIRKPEAKTPAEDFWEGEVLQLSAGLEEWGNFNWKLYVCLAVCGFIAYICVFYGVKLLGKISYLITILPIVLLICLFVRSLTLPGSLGGLTYSYPDFYRLLSFRIWYDAFLSSMRTSGVLIVYASHNNFHNNLFRQSLIIMLVKILFGLLSCLVTFSLLGFVSHESHIEIYELASSGPTQIFVVLLEAVSTMPHSAIWTAVFYIMLFIITLGAMFALVVTVTDALKELLPSGFGNKSTAAIVILFNLSVGVLFAFGNGIYQLTFFDVTLQMSFLVFASAELFAVSFFYGSNRLYENAQVMYGLRFRVWWKICWWFLTPVVVALVTLYALMNPFPLMYNNYMFPTWANILSYALSFCPLLIIIVCALVGICKEQGTFLERLRKLIRPTEGWENKRKQNSLPNVGPTAPPNSEPNVGPNAGPTASPNSEPNVGPNAGPTAPSNSGPNVEPTAPPNVLPYAL